MKPITNLLAAGLLFIALQVTGQTLTTNFTPAVVPSTPIGSNVSLQLHVTGFTNVSSLQLPISYNSAVLHFDSIDNPILVGYGDTTILSHPNPGKVVISWFPAVNLYPNGVTFPANSVILTLRFHVIGNGNTTVNVATVAPGIEVIDNVGSTFTVSYQGGGSSVTGTGVTPPPSGCSGTGTPPAATSYTGFKIIANSIHIPQGERGCMPITVNGFTAITILQFAIHWDPAVLQYECSRDFGLNDLAGSLGGSNAAGTQTLSWYDSSPTLSGVTLADGAKMYELCFKAIGAPSAQTIITIDDQGFPGGSNSVEATNASNQSLWTPNTPVKDTVFVINPANLSCPIEFTADKDTIDQNMPTCVDIKVKNFYWGSGAEFLMTYDPAKLLTPSIALGPNPLTLSTAGAGSNFTLTSGQIKFRWNNTAAVNGVTLPDNSTIFSVCFAQDVAAQGTTTPFNFTSNAPCTTSGAAIGAFRRNIGGVEMVMNSGSVYTKANVNGNISIVVDNIQGVSCNGGNNGGINITVTGGTGYTYSWQRGGVTISQVEDPTGLIAGLYSLTVTAAGGLTATATATVNQPAILAQTSSLLPISCFGGSDGGITLNPSGGTPPFSYSWVGPNGFTATTKDIGNRPMGTYTVTITDSKSCQLPATIVINQPTAVNYSTAETVVNNVKCNGGSDGSITLTATGGTPGYTVNWSGPNGYTANGLSITGLNPGTYTATILDSKGCTFVVPAFTVTNPPAIALTQGAVDNVNCFNTATGGITLNYSGGTGNFGFVWKNPLNQTVSNMQNPSGLAAGAYSVTATDSKGCTSTLGPITVNGPAAQLTVVTTATTAVTCPGANTGSICLGINGGWGNYTVVWTPPAGAATPPPIACPTGVTGGNYTAIVTDENGTGCSVTHTVTVNTPPAILDAPITVTPVTCAGTGDGCITITPTGGNGAPYTVQWSNTTLAGATICNLTGGSYAPTVTDNMGCTAVFSPITVNEPAIIVASGVPTAPTNGLNNGAIDLTVSGGSGTFTYVWNGPGVNNVATQDLSNLGVGTYSVVVSDGSCMTSTSFTIGQTNVLGGSYIVGVQNACNEDGCIFLNLPATAPGPYTITWTGDPVGQTTTSTTPSICNLAGGPYNVTVTASNGNSVVLDTFITPKQAAFVSSSKNDPFDDSHNGNISLTQLYPNSTFTFLWNTGSTSNNLINLDSGTYVVTVTNMTSGCTSVYTYVLVRQYAPAVGQFCSGLVQPSCASSSNGSICFSFSGADGPGYQYKWTGPNGYTATTATISGLYQGTYTVSVTDESNHVFVFDTVLMAQSALAITNVNELSNHNGFQVSGENLCDGAASVAFAGNAGTAGILWSNGATTVQTNTLCGGQYSVTVTDNAGCSAVWSGELTVPPVLVPSTEVAVGISCHDECDGISRVYAGGGVAPYTIQWPNGQTDQLTNSSGFSQHVNLCAGDYVVTITDLNGVVKTITVPVVNPDPIVIDFNQTVEPNSFNSCDGEFTVEALGAAAPASFIWSGSFGHNGDGQHANNLCAGEVVQFVVSDANGCSAIGIDTVPYPIDGCLRVRPVMTPGEQDGNNDFLLITCVETVSNDIQIFNRWGQLVFETTNYNNISNNWKGTNKNGQALAEGVYYYVFNWVDADGNQRQQKGYINLLL